MVPVRTIRAHTNIRKIEENTSTENLLKIFAIILDIKYGHIRPKQPAPKCILSNSTQVCVNVCLYMDLYIPPYRINNEKIFTPTKEAVLKQPRTVKAEQ